MSARSVKVLAVIVVVLFGVLFALNSGERIGTPAGSSDLLFPELKSRLNDLNLVRITDADGTVTIGRAEDERGARWVSRDHAGYPADPARLRELLLGLADAMKLERKTSDPALYDRLGVEDPRENGGDAVLVEARGETAAISLILGDALQSEYRYARIPEEAQSWLIDRNPSIPDTAAGWLRPEIVDIEASDVESVTIRHADGQVVAIRKPDADAVNFELQNLPEGRELRYPSVANGVAAALNDLVLEDVRVAGSPAQDAVATAAFHTFAGLQLEVAVQRPGEDDDEESYWVTVAASATPEAEPAAPPPAADEAEAGGNAIDTGAAATDADGDEETATPGPEEQATEINERVSGWSYRIAGYKGEQLTRRLDELLNEQGDDGTDPP